MTYCADSKQIQGYCGLCIARCGTMATVEDGRFTRLDPDPFPPNWTGALRQGPRRAGTRLSSREANTPTPPDAPEG
jgi:hypothetical protein